MTDWEAQYQAGDTPWDHGEAAPPLHELLETRPAEIWGSGAVLVPGCGRGHDAALLARAGHRVIGIDLSARALEEARRLYGDLAGLDFVVGDFLSGTLEVGEPVSAIWEHTCFCAIPLESRGAYAAAAARLLPAGGRLNGVFFLDPKVEEGPPFGVERDELEPIFRESFDFRWEARPTRVFSSREDGMELMVEMVRRP